MTHRVFRGAAMGGTREHWAGERRRLVDAERECDGL